MTSTAHLSERRTVTRRDQSLTLPAKLYLTLVAATSVAATAPLVPPFVHQIEAGSVDWWAVAFFAFCASVSQLFIVKAPGHQAYYTTAAFLVGAALLLPPILTAVVVVVVHLIEWKRQRVRWYIQVFNTCNYTCAALAAWGTAELVYGVDVSAGNISRFALAGTAAALAFVICNHVLLAQMLRLARGKTFRESGLFSVESLSAELVLALLGVGIAGIWLHALPLIPFVLTALVLIHRSLQLPTLQAAARTDSKTELFNARYLQTTLEAELGRSKRFERPVSLILADLDLLRDVNNTYGHLAGDAVLRGVADVLRTQVRSFDIPSRFGGEEFAILLPETEHEVALGLAERIRRAVEDTAFVLPHGAGAIRATISLGVASFPGADSAEQLINQADLALYRSKATGRNRVSGASEVQAAVESSAGEPAQVAPLRPAPPPRPIRGMLHPAASPAPTPLPSAESQPRPRTSVVELVATLALVAAGLIALSLTDLLVVLREHPLAFLCFLGLSTGLQLLSASVNVRGTEAASTISILGAGFALGAASAVGIAFVTAAVHVLRRRGRPYRMLFDLANFSISAGAAAWVYVALTPPGHPVAVSLAAAFAAGIVYKVVNVGSLSVAMSLDEGTSWAFLWKERFSWVVPHYLAFGPLGLAVALVYQRLGVIGLVSIAGPVSLLGLSMRQYLTRTRTTLLELQRVNSELESSNERARRQHLATIAALCRSMEAKDDYSGAHIERVGALAVALAQDLGFSGEALQAIETGALMHDIGKIGVPEALLTKPAALTEEEWEAVKQHPVISDYILAGIELHPFVRQIVRSSHERIDGAGYPDGLGAEEIPLPARIVFVADAFDAMTSDRPYRRRRSVGEALAELRAHAGTQFCPTVIGVLEQVLREQPEIFHDMPLAADAPMAASAAQAVGRAHGPRRRYGGRGAGPSRSPAQTLRVVPES